MEGIGNLIQFVESSVLQKMVKILYQIAFIYSNAVLVIIPTRLGLNKVNKEYYNPILSVFQTPLNVGIIGGRPSQALYFVGAQKQDLILLDPHLVKDSLQCSSKNDQDLKEGHLSYHSNVMRKISLTKIDTSLAFGFYLKDFQSFREFQGFLEQGRLVHKENWLFSSFETKPKEFFIDRTKEVYDDFNPDLGISPPNQSPSSNIKNQHLLNQQQTKQTEASHPKQNIMKNKYPSNSNLTNIRQTQALKTTKVRISPNTPSQSQQQPGDGDSDDEFEML